MSLQQILQSYSQDISAKVQHDDDQANENADRKANTMEEQFQNTIDHFSSGATDLGTAAGAMHLGRKVYKAYRDKKAKLNQAKEDASNKGSTETNESPQGDETSRPVESQGSQASSDPVSNAGGKVGTNLDDKADDVQQRFRDLRNRVQNPAPEPERVPVPASEASNTSNIGVPKRDMPDNAFGKTAERFQNRSNQISQAQQAQQAPAEEPAPHTADAPPTQSGGNTQVSQAPEAPQTDKYGLSDSDPFNNPKGGRSLRSEVGVNEPPQSGTTSSVGQVGRDVEGATEEGGNLLKTAGNSVRGVVSGAMDSVGNIGKSVGSAVANTAKSLVPESVNTALDTGLITTDAVLDSIPVVGEVAALITGLVGLGESLKHDPSKDRDDPSVETSDIGTAQSGIDPKSKLDEQKAQTTATLV